MKLAEALAEAQGRFYDLESVLVDLVLNSGVTAWGHIWFEAHDNSFELLRCAPDLRLSPEQLQSYWDAGFDRCWLRHNDGTSTHYSKAGP